MLDVRITAENFMMGLTKIQKGTIIQLSPVVARHVVKMGEGQIVESAKKAAPKRKSRYKRRDIKAE